MDSPTMFVALPLVAASVIALFGGYLGRRVGAVCVVALAGAFASALGWALAGDQPKVLPTSLGSWLPIPGADFALVIEPFTLPLVLMITGVSALIALYSIGYLAHDRGLQRYFFALSLFVGAMLLIVMSSNLLLLFAGWELVGLCSYLLIGHWRERPAAGSAAIKAFVVNRVGDAAFLVGIFLILVEEGTVAIGALGDLSVPASGLLLVGALAKSAQLPLHTWLPDAMEGPTPVSALIHAATMVTAGVVLLVRIGGSLAPEALIAAAIVGAVTALFAATVASFQTDVKRVLAWSTVSQIGLMFVAAGVSAIFAALFHLLAHAFFKAALFLGAGSVLHATDDELDIRRLGGLARRTRWTTLAFGIGALGLAAVPPLSGFFSKEAIAAAVVDRPLLLAAVLLTSALSALYALRLFTLVFLGEPRSDRAEHAHESPAVMLVPLVALAGAALGFGVWVTFGGAEIGPHDEHHAPTWLVVTSIAIAASGAVAGWLLFRGGPRAEASFALPAGGYHIDALYERIAVAPFRATARVLDDGAERTNEAVLDGVAALVVSLSGAARRVQGGNVRAYEALLLVGVVLLVTYWSAR